MRTTLLTFLVAMGNKYQNFLDTTSYFTFHCYLYLKNILHKCFMENVVKKQGSLYSNPVENIHISCFILLYVGNKIVFTDLNVNHVFEIIIR